MNGDTILTLQRTEDSYCLNCRAPARVGVLTVAGWRHSVGICAACLRRVTEAVEGVVPPEGGKERRNADTD